MIQIPIYIQGAGSISAQKTWDKKIIAEGFIAHEGNRWVCQEPDYSDWIDSRAIRRMSRVLQQCNIAAQLAMKECNLECPEAIIVGSAMGCLEDTWSFLSKMVHHQEEMLSPTAFIHSTHNTMASHLALHVKCFGHNCTFVHRNISFEHALTDAILLLEEGKANNILVGGADEVTDISFDILSQLGQIKQAPSGAPDSQVESSSGWVAGEGASFFVLGNEQTPNSYAKLSEVGVYSGYTSEEIVQFANKLIASVHPAKTMILAGHNGDESEDKMTDQVLLEVAPEIPMFKYKALCGEFGTSSSFALWMAAHMLKNQITPSNTGFQQVANGDLEHVLIYHQTGQLHHSFILVERC